MTRKRDIVIAFLGRAGSGKSTAAKHVATKYNGNLVSFATPVKRLAKILYRFTDDQVFGNQAEKEAVDPRYGISPRIAMQRLGTGARDVIGNHVWVDACLSSIANQAGISKQLFVIDDCRHYNEVVALENAISLEPYIIRLTCPDTTTTVDSKHPTEAEVDMVPDVSLFASIESATSVGSKDLLAKVDKVVQQILKG